MDVPDKWLLLIGTMSYVAALVLTLVRLTNRRPPLHGLNLGLILAGWVFQSTGMWILGMEAGSCPIRNPFEVLQFVSWSVVVLYLFTGQVFRLSLFGTGSAALAAIIGFTAFMIPGTAEATPPAFIGGDPRIEAHAALALFSYGIFGLLAVLSILYLLQNNSLKTKRNPGIFRFLPSLVEMDTVFLRLLIIACFVYTVSIVIGGLYWISHPEQLSPLKTGPTLALWLAYWVVLALRLSNRLFGTRLAWSCIFLLVAALLILWPVEITRDRSELPSATSQSELPHNDP